MPHLVRSSYHQRTRPSSTIEEVCTRTSLTNDCQICKLGVNRTPTQILHAREPLVLVAGRLIEKPVIYEILEEIRVIQNVLRSRSSSLEEYICQIEVGGLRQVPCKNSRCTAWVLSNLHGHSCSSSRERRHEKDLDDLEDKVPILSPELGLGGCRFSSKLGNICKNVSNIKQCPSTGTHIEIFWARRIQVC